jgi:hypothetical protein
MENEMDAMRSMDAIQAVNWCGRCDAAINELLNL